MNLEGWEIDVESLPGPARGAYPVDVLFPSPDHEHAVLVYSIDEIRMGWDVGMLAVYHDRDNPRLILNPSHFLCCYTSDSVTWLSNSMFAAKKHYYGHAANKINVPIALIDLAASRYSFIPLENSYPYKLRVDQSEVQLVEQHRDERLRSHHGERHLFSELTWYGLNELDHFDHRYAEFAIV